MTDKEFKKLRRSELIEIIYEYQKNEEQMKEEIDSLRAQLDSKELKIKNSGSIAEAVVSLNELFETAQKTADDYIDQVKRKCTEEITDAAKKEADDILSDARKKADEILAKARKNSSKNKK